MNQGAVSGSLRRLPSDCLLTAAGRVGAGGWEAGSCEGEEDRRKELGAG